MASATSYDIPTLLVGLGCILVGAALLGLIIFASGGTLATAVLWAAGEAGFAGTLLALATIFGFNWGSSDGTTTTSETTSTTTDGQGNTTSTTTTTTTSTTGPTFPDGGEGDPWPWCFVSGTLVSTPAGRRPIETLRIGDVVHAHNVSTGALEPRPICCKHSGWSRELVVLKFDGEVVRCTPLHRFYTNQWTPAVSLRVGDRIRTGNASAAEIKSIQAIRKRVRVHNLVVEGHRTYLVSAVDAVGSSDKGSTIGQPQ